MTTAHSELIVRIERALDDRGGKTQRNEVRFRCPFPDRHANGDLHPSARWNRSKGVWRCDACGAGGGYINLAAALDIEPKSDGPRRIIATYDYTDEGGTLLYQVVRCEPKAFRQRRPDGNGGWLWNLNGVRRVLYRLREVLAGPMDAFVFAPEGEKDVDALRAIGLIATCNPAGAGKWRAEYNEHLRGRHVVVIPDADEPGRRHADDVIRHLLPIAASVRRLELDGTKDVTDWLAAGHTAEELLAVVERAAAIDHDAVGAVPEPSSSTSSSSGDAPEGDDRRTVQLEYARWNKCIRQAAGAVRDIVYMRDTVPMLLRSIERSDGRTIEGAGGMVEIEGVRHEVGSLLLMDATAGRVRYHLDERVQFLRYSERDGWVRTRCHSDIAAQLVANATAMGFRPCAGIVYVPLFVEGDIVSAPGWHSPSGLILDILAPPVIPAWPTRADAKHALNRLLHPFRGFDASVDRCVLAAAALTAVLRPSLRTAPAILLDGNGPGVGKGLIARTLTVIATGGTPAVITEGHNPEETEKRIAAALLSGVPVVLLDNLQRHVASSALESAITEGMATIRSFGTLTNLHVPCRALILLTANNATMRRDMLRRTLPVRIVVPVENPEERQFDFDPLIEAQQERGELVAAAFTIVRAWWHVRELAEHRRHHRPLGSFPQWAEFVAAPVAWLTGRNPIELIEARKAQDAYAGAERTVIEAIAKRYHDHTWKAADAAKDISPELWADAMPRLDSGANPSPNAVGYWLRRRKDCVFGKWILEAAPDRTGVNEWRLMPTAGDAGHAGDVPPDVSKNASGNNDCGDGANSSKTGGKYPQHPQHPQQPETEIFEI